MMKSKESQFKTSRAFCQNLRGILDKSLEEQRWEVVKVKLLHLGGEKPHKSVERVLQLQESSSRQSWSLLEADMWLQGAIREQVGLVEAAESGLDLRRLLLASGEGKEDELAAVSLRLRVELDWVEERLAAHWAEALDDYYKRCQASVEEAWVTIAVEDLPSSGNLALYQAV